MKILVTYGSERGGTADIAARIAAGLRDVGHEVELLAAGEVRDVRPFDAVIVGGALYALRWHAEARRFVLRHARALREREVFFFSSGPLDGSAAREALPPPRQVRELLGYVGAREHATFGGRLAPDARGLVASRMAKTSSGDWRDPVHIESWARHVAARLEASPAERPPFSPLPSRALPLVLCLAIGIAALVGGVLLLASLDGALLGTEPGALARSPLRGFVIPGVVLVAAIGAAHLVAAWLHFVRSDCAPFVTLTSAASLAIWSAIEMAVLGSASIPELAVLAIGAILVIDSVSRIRATVSEWSEVRPPHPA